MARSFKNEEGHRYDYYLVPVFSWVRLSTTPPESLYGWIATRFAVICWHGPSRLAAAWRKSFPEYAKPGNYA